MLCEDRSREKHAHEAGTLVALNGRSEARDLTDTVWHRGNGSLTDSEPRTEDGVEEPVKDEPDAGIEHEAREPGRPGLMISGFRLGGFVVILEAIS
jgi:hypothetical protein